MLTKNVVAPYDFKLEKRLFLFNMHYARVEEYINQLCQLHRASSLHACEQNDMVGRICSNNFSIRVCEIFKEEFLKKGQAM